MTRLTPYQQTMLVAIEEAQLSSAQLNIITVRMTARVGYTPMTDEMLNSMQGRAIARRVEQRLWNRWRREQGGQNGEAG
jgi:hypothetical protein